MNALAISDSPTPVGPAAEEPRERGSFEELVLPHRNELYACALRYTRNPGDAEDLVQEALMRAFAA